MSALQILYANSQGLNTVRQWMLSSRKSPNEPNYNMQKILLIEDDQLISRIYHRILSLEGYEVAIAEKGEEGLIKAKSLQPSIILMDIMMPDMDGISALKILKADPATQKIPVIVTSNASNEVLEQTIAQGAAKYIVKSDKEPSEVVEIVKSILVGNPQS
jgi:CheY-like chemotaxis protein